MGYIAQSDIAGELPPEFLVEALDDDRDGVADESAWDALQAAVSRDIHDLVSARFATPLASPYPPAVVGAAAILTLEKLYARRGYTPDRNPWSAQAKEAREKLGRIGAGELPLSTEVNRARPSVSIIGEASRTKSTVGNMAI